MKIQKHTTTTTLATLAAALLLAGCSTVSSRISKNQQLFDTWPENVQTSVRAGQVEVGFTPEMVTMALGEPSRRYTRSTSQGSSEVWAYQSKGPSISFGLGIGGGIGRTGIGTGLGVIAGGDRSDDKMRVIFEEGKVSAVEQTR